MADEVVKEGPDEVLLENSGVRKVFLLLKWGERGEDAVYERVGLGGCWVTG